MKALVLLSLILLVTTSVQAGDRGPACARLNSAPREISEIQKQDLRSISSDLQKPAPPTAMEDALVSHNGSPDSVDCEIEANE